MKNLSEYHSISFDSKQAGKQYFQIHRVKIMLLAEESQRYAVYKQFVQDNTSVFKHSEESFTDKYL